MNNMQSILLININIKLKRRVLDILPLSVSAMANFFTNYYLLSPTSKAKSKLRDIN